MNTNSQFDPAKDRHPLPGHEPVAVERGTGKKRSARRAAKHSAAQGAGVDPRVQESGQRKQQRKRRTRAIIIAVLAVLLALGGAGAVLFSSYGSIIAERLGFGEPKNYAPGEQTGEATVTVRSGDTGTVIAAALEAANIVKTADGFVEYLLQEQPDATFNIGTYKMQQKMTPEAAFEAIQNPENKVDLRVTIPEGFVVKTALDRLATATSIPLSEFEEAAKDYVALGVPADFPSIEGFLFPATYEFQPDDDARTILKTLVDRMWQALSEHGVPAEDALEVLTKASLVQREAGPNLDDFPKIARVFQNRLDQGMNLQSDASVAYGTGNLHTVWTTDKERADAGNKYNTYANPGLPIGPIGLPSDAAIAAALNPTPGPWLYFMPINLETGETRFSNTIVEHEENVKLLGQWCTAHRAEGGKLCD
ncbi:endolytic transglycosylase MltG [Leucobacter sp. OH1287]|uniref:endolytic transglycosylase MltG n=1 Tax=Leucobacter sp. OH1287 TaxID=2491049 RepID=UPI000F5EDEB3|nr:endolytic transglycosylase MltG [Leucobacter sp. OH1287]RRD59721.1 endolytic transglycosylase MltG [Leucobacter sp. OH1287]